MVFDARWQLSRYGVAQSLASQKIPHEWLFLMANIAI